MTDYVKCGNCVHYEDSGDYTPPGAERLLTDRGWCKVPLPKWVEALWARGGTGSVARNDSAHCAAFVPVDSARMWEKGAA